MARESIDNILREAQGLHRAERLVEAEALYRRALQIDPNHPDALHLFGLLACDCNQDEVAVDMIGHAITLNPNNPVYHANLAMSLQRMGRTSEAIAGFREAIRLEPDHASFHMNLGLSLLLSGNYAEGFVENEWRMRLARWREPWANDTQPVWDGSDPAGVMILLRAEQGLGDTIQFIRYVPMLADAGAHVLLACQPVLADLLHRVRGVATLCSEAVTPPYDVRLPLMSLPHRLGTTLSNIPATTPYLSAPPLRVKEWRSRVGPSDGRLRVGLAWAGNPNHINDRMRSIPLPMFAPLASISGVQFVSLQKDRPEAQTAPVGLDLLDYTAEINDLADTAALIENLDLVICVDTAIAHLAGALGKKTWVLLPFLPDWRWMMDREDSPWYPTIRLFRQPVRGDWASVIQRIVNELAVMRDRMRKT